MRFEKQNKDKKKNSEGRIVMFILESVGPKHVVKPKLKGDLMEDVFIQPLGLIFQNQCYNLTAWLLLYPYGFSSIHSNFVYLTITCPAFHMLCITFVSLAPITKYYVPALMLTG